MMAGGDKGTCCAKGDMYDSPCAQRLLFTSPLEVFKSVGPKLVPFIKAVCVYFVAGLPTEHPTIFSTILKCLPIMCLWAFVCMQGMSLREEHDYNRRILTALVFSCIGDAFLHWEKCCLIPGIAAFAVAQAMYVRAFGFTPLNLKVGLLLGIIPVAVYAIMFPFVPEHLKFGVPVYVLLLFLMAWRAITRVYVNGREYWLWTEVCACGGALLFCMSDTIWGVNKFVMPLPLAQALIMTLYYAGQLGIALSSYKGGPVAMIVTPTKPLEKKL